jgi:hypothetical protein
MLRMRKTLLSLCIALVVCGALASVVSSHLAAILPPLWPVVPVLSIVVIRRQPVRGDEQPVALRSLSLSRAPPISQPLA